MPPDAENVPAVLDPVRAPFRAAARVMVPAMRNLPERQWAEAERVVENALRQRPPAVRRQIRLLLRLIEWLPVTRFGRRFSRLSAARRLRVLSALQDAPLLLLRRGVWGLRTLVFMGYYARPGAGTAIGYRAHLRGWRGRADVRPAVELPPVSPSKEVGPLPKRGGAVRTRGTPPV